MTRLPFFSQMLDDRNCAGLSLSSSSCGGDSGNKSF